VQTPTKTSASPTPNVIATLVAKEKGKIIEQHLSPDGQWQINVTTYPCRTVKDSEIKIEQMELIEVTSKTTFVIQTQTLICEEGLGAVGLGGLFWSPDSQIFYYTDARVGVPDGCGGYCWNRPLLALYINDVTTQSLAKIWSYSEEAKQIAIGQKEQVVLQNLEGEIIQRIPLHPPDAKICQILWEPDGENIVYLQTSNPFVPGLFTLVNVDQDSHKSTVLLALENATFISANWKIPTLINVSGIQNGKHQQWTVDYTQQNVSTTP
jgi:hypothetical protein